MESELVVLGSHGVSLGVLFAAASVVNLFLMDRLVVHNFLE